MTSPALRTYLDTLSLVEASDSLRRTRSCKLCGHPAPYFDAVDFNKNCGDLLVQPSRILVGYYRCEHCELIFTDFCDDWSATDFSNFIYNDEYVLVDPEYLGARADRAATDLAPSLVGAEQERILDFGSGAGKFALEMKKRGFPHVESYDPFVHPTMPAGKFSIVTCSDVIEHSPRPAETLSTILNFLADDGVALVGQTLQPPDIGEIKGNWWYLAPRNGHVTTYSGETMRLYAEDNGLLFDNFGDLFALSRPRRSALSSAIVERRHPRRWRMVVQAPPPLETPQYGAWQAAESLDGGYFRWTRVREVSLGTHRIDAGSCRIAIPFHIAIVPGFAERIVLRVGETEWPMSVRKNELVATICPAESSLQHISLRTPPMVTPDSLGVPGDVRELGIAIWCERQNLAGEAAPDASSG